MAVCENCNLHPISEMQRCCSGHILCSSCYCPETIVTKAASTCSVCRTTKISWKSSESKGDAYRKKEDREGHTLYRKSTDLVPAVCSVDLAGGDNIPQSSRARHLKQSKEDNSSSNELCLHGVKKCIEVKCYIPGNFPKYCQKSARYESDTRELKMEYRNVTFADSKSTIEEDSENCKLKPFLRKTQDISCNKNCLSSILKTQRPIICPISKCSRTVAGNSLTTHFCFDHSKVPFVSTLTSKAESVVLNIDLLRRGRNHCVAFFLVPNKFRSSDLYHTKDDSSLSILLDRCRSTAVFPLMASRLSFCDPPSDICKPSLKTTTKGENTYEEITTPSLLEAEEVLILWVCGIDEQPTSYRITLRGADRGYSHSYLGRVVVAGQSGGGRGGGDARAVLRRADCLLVPGAAVNRLRVTRAGSSAALGSLSVELVLLASHH